MNELTSSTKTSLLKRVLTGAGMVLIGIPALLFGSWYLFTLLAALEIVAIYEILKAPRKGRYSILVYIVTYVFIILMSFSPFIFNYSDIISGNLITYKDLSLPVLFTIAYLLILFMISLGSTTLMVNDVCYLFTMGVFVSFAFVSFFYLRYLPNSPLYYDGESLKSSLLFSFIIVGTVFNDVGAYAVGVMFGKHKMIPRVSPHKTWEGFAGGVVISMLASFFFAFGIEKAGYPLLPGIIDLDNWWRIAVLCFFIPFVGDIGDLIFSLVKRNFGIKDFGSIFPGHGGVLDRIDSLTTVSIVAALFIYLCINGWKALL